VKEDPDAEYLSYAQGRLPALRRLAMALCGDASRADDLVQQTLTSLYVYWRRVRALEQADAYVRKIMVRAHLSDQRLAWARRVSLVGSVPETGATRAEDVEARLVLLDALRRLPPRQRAVLALRYLDDQPVEVVAEILGCAPGTVKSQASRGLDTLRALLNDSTAGTREATRG
jgi:RNA polymerase sigma-70 factor (sigma-E family)